MTWLAVGGCTAAAGYALYVLVSQYNAKVSQKLSVPFVAVEDTSSENLPPEAEKTSKHFTEQDSKASTTESMTALRKRSPSPVTAQMGKLRANGSVEAGKEKQIVQDSMQSMPPPPTTSKKTVTRSQSPPRLKPPTFSCMPAPPRPSNGTLRTPPPSSASSLRIPPTKVLPNASMAPSSSSSLMPQKQQQPSSKSRQVILKPGHSPLDWAALTSNPTKTTVLRGNDAQPPERLLRVTPSRLKFQNGRKGKDAWTVYQGKVYNITAYLAFHPGGEAEIMKGAGRDSAKLFLEVHPWVNWDGMLGECLVGILVSETEEERGGDRDDLDEMD